MTICVFVRRDRLELPLNFENDLDNSLNTKKIHLFPFTCYYMP